MIRARAPARESAKPPLALGLGCLDTARTGIPEPAGQANCHVFTSRDRQEAQSKGRTTGAPDGFRGSSELFCSSPRTASKPVEEIDGSWRGRKSRSGKLIPGWLLLVATLGSEPRGRTFDSFPRNCTAQYANRQSDQAQTSVTVVGSTPTCATTRVLLSWRNLADALARGANSVMESRFESG